MSKLASLAKETVIYGVSSIVGRFLNYLLVPMYVSVMAVESGGYGVVTNIYAFVALFLVLLTYGMETGFFRFMNKEKENQQVYSSILISVGITSLLFILLCLTFLQPISSFLGYTDYPSFIGMMAIVVALDAFQSIPFAYLRYKRRPIKFAGIKLFIIALNIFLNFFFLIWCPKLVLLFPDLFVWYDPSFQAGYVFFANLITSSLQLLFFIPELKEIRHGFNKPLMKRILRYSFPILILGIAGILNQTIDKIIFPFLFSDGNEARVQLGIYGAASKIAMIMAMFTQAFRYAYEPFVFGEDKKSDSGKMYASAMKYFIIFALLAFLIVMFYLDLLKYIITPGYWEGLKVVPIVMGAELLMGIYFNLSFWYKLIDETKWGAYFSLVGCVVIVLLNIIFVPQYGYIASAWSGLIGYLVVTILSYVVGQKKYPIPYDLKGIFFYFLLACSLSVAGKYVIIDNLWLRLGYRTLLLTVFLVYLVKKDLPLRNIPIINRFIK